MVVIVTVCAAFGLTASEAKIELMCLGTRGVQNATATLSVEAVDLGESVNYDAGLFIEFDRRTRGDWCSFRKYTLELYDRLSAPREV